MEKNITIEIPEGKKVIYEKEGDRIVIKFTDKKKYWRAIKGENFYYISISSGFKIIRSIEHFNENSTNLWKIHNYFKTAEKAEEALENLKDFFVEINK